MSDLELIKAQRNVFMGKYRSMASLMEAARSKIRQVSDHTHDEGDRVYFGSTNHADWLKDLAEDMEGWMIDFYLPKGDINKLERDPYAHIREQRTRIAALEAENAKLRAALIEASTRMKNARSACESNQVIDKDVHGTLTRGMFEIAEALGE